MRHPIKPKRTLLYASALRELQSCFGNKATYEDNERDFWTLGETIENHDPNVFNAIVAIQWIGDFKAQMWSVDDNGYTSGFLAEISPGEED